MTQPAPVSGDQVRCLRCGRFLTNPLDRYREYGPICWKKISAKERAQAPQGRPSKDDSDIIEIIFKSNENRSKRF